MDGSRERIRWSPPVWVLCFKERTDTDWLNRWIRGRFKHVCAFGFVPGPNLIVFVEQTCGMLHVEALHADDREAMDRMADMVTGATVMEMARGFGDLPNWRPVMSCVSVTAHLLGIRSSALLPDGLFRDCLRLGGSIVESADEDGRSETADRPGG